MGNKSVSSHDPLHSINDKPSLQLQHSDVKEVAGKQMSMSAQFETVDNQGDSNEWQQPLNKEYCHIPMSRFIYISHVLVC